MPSNVAKKKKRKLTAEKRAAISRKDAIRDVPTLPDTVIYQPITVIQK